MFHFREISFQKDLFFSFFIILVCPVVFGQKMQYHNRNDLGANSVQDITFNYTISNKDTLIQDEYQSLLFSYHPDSISNIRKLRLNYKNGIPHGEFYLEKATFKSNHNFPSYRNFRVQHAIKGSSLFATGQYVNGIRTGTWTQYDVLIDDRRMDTLSSIYANFSKNGQWNGLFTIKDTNLNLKGTIVEGSPNGNWEGTWNNQAVTLQFDKNNLTHFTVGNKTIEFVVPTDGRFVVENLHEILPQYVAIFPSIDDQLNEDAYLIASKIAASIRGFIPNKNLTEAKNKKFQFDAVKIVLPLNVLSNNDKSALVEVCEKYRLLTNSVDNLLEEPSLLLSRDENIEIAKSMLVFQEIAKQLKTYAPAVEIASSNMSSYANWENLVRLITQKSEKNYDSSQSAIQNLNLQINDLIKAYEANNVLVEKYLVETQNSEELTRLRQEFVNLQLRTMEDEIELLNVPYYEKEYREGFNHFKNLIIDRFKVASENSNKEQMESLFNQGANLVTLLQQTSEWVRLHEVILERNKYMYLDANTFEERKEVLYVQLQKAYERKLMPFVIGQLKFNFNHFNEFKASFDNITLVQQKMLDLFDQDPKKMNRKLKNGDSVDKVIEKMGLILN